MKNMLVIFDTKIERARARYTFIGPESDHWLCFSLTDSLPFSKLDWCDPGMWECQLKLVEVITVADVDSEDHVDNSLLQIWELKFGPKAKLLFRLWAQGFVKILKLKFSKILKLELVQHFVADVL